MASPATGNRLRSSARTIILAQSLDIPVLAEGVENEEHMDFLRSEGCLQVQGYLFGKPMPLSAIDHVVNNTQPVIAAPVPSDDDAVRGGQSEAA